MADEISALEKHACPACGAQAEWNPTKQKLVCPFCGTESPYQIDRATGKVAEIDLVAALRDLPEDERGWQTARRSVQCQSCHAVMVFEADRVGQNCEFCGSPALVSYDEIKAPIRPHGRAAVPRRHGARARRHPPLVAQQVAGAGQTRQVRARRHRARPVHPVLDVRRAGALSVGRRGGPLLLRQRRGRDSKGQRVTRKERRIRWEPASGVVDHFFDDEPVPGTQGLPLDLLRQVEPFPTQELVAYDTAFLSGHVVEHYKVVLIDAAKQSQEQMHRGADADLRSSRCRATPTANLQIHPVFSGRTFKHVLVPIWLLSYNYGRAGVPGRRQRLHGQDRGTLPLQLDQDRAPGHPRGHRDDPDLVRHRLSITAEDHCLVGGRAEARPYNLPDFIWS